MNRPNWIQRLEQYSDFVDKVQVFCFVLFTGAFIAVVGDFTATMAVLVAAVAACLLVMMIFGVWQFFLLLKQQRELKAANDDELEPMRENGA